MAGILLLLLLVVVVVIVVVVAAAAVVVVVLRVKTLNVDFGCWDDCGAFSSGHASSRSSATRKE